MRSVFAGVLDTHGQTVLPVLPRGGAQMRASIFCSCVTRELRAAVTGLRRLESVVLSPSSFRGCSTGVRDNLVTFVSGWWVALFTHFRRLARLTPDPDGCSVRLWRKERRRIVQLPRALPGNERLHQEVRRRGGAHIQNFPLMSSDSPPNGRPAGPERVRLARRLSCCGRQPVPMTSGARRRPGRTVRNSFLGVCV